MKLFWLFMICLIAACGELETDKSSTETMQVDVQDEKADAGRWKVRANETSVWFDTRVKAVGDGTFVLGGRISRNIKSATAVLQNGRPLAIKKESARRFQIQIDDATLIELARGQRIFSTFDTTTGRVTGMALYAPRLGTFEGDKEMFILSSFNPIIVASTETLRGRLSVPDGWSLEVATSDVGWEGDVGYDPIMWTFDFELSSLPHLLDAAPLTFLATDVESQTLTKTAYVRMRLAQLGATTDAPHDVWPQPTCGDEIAECLSHEPDDTEACGYLNEVTACLPEHAFRFADDLSDAIRGYYEANGALIRVREGRTLADALAKISPFNVRDAEPFDVSGFQHDVRAAKIVYHPGVIFRDSPHLWYGAYAKDGTLIEIRLVNNILD